MSKTVAIRNNMTGIIKMGNAIGSKDCNDGSFFTENDKCIPVRTVYEVCNKTMKQIWKQKIDEIQEIIEKTLIIKDGRIKQLHKKKELLQQAFGRL